MRERDCEACGVDELARVGFEAYALVLEPHVGSHAVRWESLPPFQREGFAAAVLAIVGRSRAEPSADDTVRVCAALANYRALSLEHQTLRQELRRYADAEFLRCAACGRFATGVAPVGAGFHACDAHGSNGLYRQAPLARLLEDGG